MKKRKDSPACEDPVTSALSGAAAATVLSVLTLNDLDDQVDALVARLSDDEGPSAARPGSRPKPTRLRRES